MVRATRFVSLATIAVMLVGCGGQDSAPDATPAPPNLDPPVQYTTEWTAPAGTDLFDRSGELVRAAVEAGDYAISFGVGAFPDYPPFSGYREAIGAPYEGDGRYSPYYYARSPKEPDSAVWAQYYRLAKLESDAKTIDATVCGYGLGVNSTENYKPLTDQGCDPRAAVDYRGQPRASGDSRRRRVVP